jgi:hypothetical protein
MAYGIFPHSEQQQQTGRGYVVLELAKGLRLAIDAFNYGHQISVKTYLSKTAAQKACDKLNSK